MSRLILGLVLLLFTVILQAKPLEIVMWHSLAGSLGEELSRLVHSFNKSQSEYAIKMVYKGEYSDTLTSFAAAFRAKQPPSLVQIFEVGTASMLYPAGIIKPLSLLLTEQGIRLPVANFLPAIRNFYSLAEGMQAMPLNTSVPVIFYNADALQAIGISETNFPKTWQNLEAVAAKLHKNGYACGYTSAYAAWIHIESFSALHDLPLVNAKHNQVTYNNPAIIKHLERLRRWQKLHYFEYGGRTNDATVLFTSGHCALFSQSSGSYRGLAALVNFRLGVAPMPLDESVSKQRHNNVIGGAALWAVNGQSAAHYRGIARFYAYLAAPEVQQRWYQNTGYIPLSGEAPLAGKSNQAVLSLAKVDLSQETASIVSLNRIPQNQLRTINDEALEAIFSGIKSPKAAMDAAVARANYTLERFVRNTGQ